MLLFYNYLILYYQYQYVQDQSDMTGMLSNSFLRKGRFQQMNKNLDH